MQGIDSLKDLLSSSKRIIVTTHHKPDADALGSSLACAAYLKKKGHQVTVLSPTDYPDFLHWMSGNEEVLIYTEAIEKGNALVAEADLIFCLDFSSLNRINELGEEVRKSKATKILVDHHQNPENFAQLSFWSTGAAATAELIYEMIDAAGDKALIDSDMAESLYAGIMTDTGSFKHPNTTKNVHRIVAELIDLGADIAKVSKNIYDNNSVTRLKFLGFCLNERLVVLEELKTAYFVISKEDLAQFQVKTGDTEGLVNYALSIKDIAFATLIIEREDAVKMSFRSVGNFSVSNFAEKYFSGGGHKNAAGGRSEDGLGDTVKKFSKLILEHQKEIQNSYTAGDVLAGSDA